MQFSSFYFLFGGLGLGLFFFFFFFPIRTHISIQGTEGWEGWRKRKPEVSFFSIFFLLK